MSKGKMQAASPRTYYVTMTDPFFSGWGRAVGKTNKLVIVCESWEEAEAVEAYAKRRAEMTYVRITTRKPYYNAARYYAQYKTREDYPAWFAGTQEHEEEETQ